MKNDEASLKRKPSENDISELSEKKPRQDGSIEALLSPNSNLDNVPTSTGVNPRQGEINPLDCEEMVTLSTEPTTNDIYGASASEGGKLLETVSPMKLKASSVRGSTASVEPNKSSSVTETAKDTLDEKHSNNYTESRKVEKTSNSEEAGKKIKWGCGQHFSDRSDHNFVSLTEISNSKQTTTSLSNSKTAVPPSNLTPSPPKREKCAYGSKCYRKNEQHKAQFSHPGDSDYDELDSRPECRYGIRCYRKNPQHRRDYKHTIQCRRRPQTPIRSDIPDTSATDQSSFEESVDESEYEPSYCTDSSDGIQSDWDDK